MLHSVQADGPLLAVLVALLLGVRHGIDWDHIAAITDVTSGGSTYRRGLLLGSMYAAGHSTIVLVLGSAAVLLGLELPEWVDGAMGPVVGATLVLLGAWILYTLLRSPERFRMRSRWMLLLEGGRAAYKWFRGTDVKHIHQEAWSAGYTWRTAFAIGLIHGIGAETPTQVLLFVSAAGAGGSALALTLVFAFIAGLFASNTAISFASVFGYVSASRRRSIYLGAGALTGVFSLVVGSLFMFGRTSLLPTLLGG